MEDKNIEKDEFVKDFGKIFSYFLEECLKKYSNNIQNYKTTGKTRIK